MRRLNTEEQRLWARVVASVRPLDGVTAPPLPPEPAPKEDKPAPPKLAAVKTAPLRKRPGTTLDGTWDRRLSRGAVAPDLIVDLHGHNLATAWNLLDRRLEQAIAAEARLLLLVTGKPPGPERPVKRGAIRAAIGDWLAASRHAAAIAAVRTAHPRHGGAGALYIVLRRRRA
jgi:DNA-nicking Smr family endonuclease